MLQKKSMDWKSCLCWLQMHQGRQMPKTEMSVRTIYGGERADWTVSPTGGHDEWPGRCRSQEPVSETRTHMTRKSQKRDRSFIKCVQSSCGLLDATTHFLKRVSVRQRVALRWSVHGRPRLCV